MKTLAVVALVFTFTSATAAFAPKSNEDLKSALNSCAMEIPKLPAVAALSKRVRRSCVCLAVNEYAVNIGIYRMHIHPKGYPDCGAKPLRIYPSRHKHVPRRYGARQNFDRHGGWKARWYNHSVVELDRKTVVESACLTYTYNIIWWPNCQLNMSVTIAIV